MCGHADIHSPADSGRSTFSAGGVSIFHLLDARVKIVAAALWSTLLAAISSIPAAFLGLSFSLVFILLARWPWRNLVKRLSVVNFFLLFMWLILPFSFSSPGRVVASWGFLEVTREGVDLALLLTVKANAILIAVIALLGTSPLFVLAAAGRKLGLPEKLVGLFLLTTRYFEVIFLEFQKLRLAMRARGFEARLNLHTCRSFANLIGSLLVRSFDRADRVHRAMLCRGYTGTIWVKDDFAITSREMVFIGLTVFIISVVGGAQWLPVS